MLLPLADAPPTFTVTSLAGLMGFNGFVTSLVSLRILSNTCVALFLTTWPSVTLMTVIGMVTVYVWPRSVWSMAGWDSGSCPSDSP